MHCINVLAVKAMVALHGVLAESKPFNDGTIKEGGGGNDFNTFLDNAGGDITRWAGVIVGILGIIALLAGVYFLVTGLISQGKKHVSWVVVVLLFVVGGMMAVGGWSTVASIGAGLNETVNSCALPTALGWASF